MGYGSQYENAESEYTVCYSSLKGDGSRFRVYGTK